ncbi:Ctr copper transporter [Pluteus cervinus]|uniref:Ctr copper transporter n=1 Tax=Pluteus cervinus TaxID=181527 RepID=A0ACD3ALR3_9AGAR|nr:Ctr copper transporter [Pluteus cervinus]
MPMGPQCSMHMLWNTQIADTCIVFKSWHISTNFGFVIACLVIVGLGVLYEYLRVLQQRLDVHVANTLVAQGRGKVRASSGRSTPDRVGEESGLLTGQRLFKTTTPVPLVFRILRAGVYGATVFLSFFLMLVFMTYNAYLITATVVGATLGHYIFASTINTEAVLSGVASGKGMSCH